MNELYRHNDKLYIIKRQVPQHNFIKRGETKIGKEGMDYLNAWRNRSSCDHVLRTQTHYLFCQTITDIEYEVVDT